VIVLWACFRSSRVHFLSRSAGLSVFLPFFSLQSRVHFFLLGHIGPSLLDLRMVRTFDSSCVSNRPPPSPTPSWSYLIIFHWIHATRRRIFLPLLSEECLWKLPQKSWIRLSPVLCRLLGRTRCLSPSSDPWPNGPFSPLLFSFLTRPFSQLFSGGWSFVRESFSFFFSVAFALKMEWPAQGLQCQLQRDFPPGVFYFRRLQLFGSCCFSSDFGFLSSCGGLIYPVLGRRSYFPVGHVPPFFASPAFSPMLRSLHPSFFNPRPVSWFF